MINTLVRRFRSASFRAGLITSVIVGCIVVLPVAFSLATLTISVTNIDVTTIVQDPVDEIEGGIDPRQALDTASVDDNELLALLNSNGEVVHQVGDAPLAVRQELADPKHRVDADIRDEDRSLVLVGTTEWIVVSDEASDPDGTTYLLASARPVPVASVPVLLSFGLGVFLVGLIAGASGFTSAWVVRRSLRRIDSIQTEVQQISSKSLHRRLPTRDIADPIDRLPHTMNQMLERLEEAQRQRDQFIADASHELRSPVAGTLALLEVAIEYPDRIDATELLPKLHADSLRTQALVQDLLYLSRLESRSEKEFDYLSLPEAVGIVNDEVDRYRSNTSHAEVHLDLSKLILDSSDETKVLQLSKSHLGRIIQNLVDNALRHCTKRVTISVHADPPMHTNRQITIAVSDDGSGIDSQDRDRVFSRFVRLDEARSRDKGGSGLGLAITKELVQSAGGSISIVDSTEPKHPGATFEVQLPAEPTQ